MATPARSAADFLPARLTLPALQRAAPPPVAAAKGPARACDAKSVESAQTFVTVHPAAILRLIGGVVRERAFVQLVTELTTVWRVVSSKPSKNPQQNADFPRPAL